MHRCRHGGRSAAQPLLACAFPGRQPNHELVAKANLIELNFLHSCSTLQQRMLSELIVRKAPKVIQDPGSPKLSKLTLGLAAAVHLLLCDWERESFSFWFTRSVLLLLGLA